MIVWTGWGILGVVLWAACLGITVLVTDAIGGAGYYTSHFWPKVLASAVSAPVIWGVGLYMNGSPQSKKRRRHGARHTLFFVPLEYWGPILFAFGFVVGIIHTLAAAP